jgi:exopolyphosphatase/guanosine-5'-triphosphate,3'-diphosphate pyrophosphatase
VRVGIIDLGTNSVRYDVHQLGPAGRSKTLHREKLMIRLGQGVFLDGKLDPEAIRRALEAFASFERTARELHVDRIIAFGTSALREAADSERLLKQIRTRTGIDVRVISGVEEARLIAEGVLAHIKPPKGASGLIDIGGGSVEINICRGKRVLNSESFPLGTARLQQVFLKSSPPAPARKGQSGAIDQLRRYIKSVLLPKIIADEWPRVGRVYGSSGTIRAIARLLKKNGGSPKTFDLAALKKLNKKMSTMTTTQLLGIPGMEARRVDMILAGSVLLEECLEALHCRKVVTTEYSLRDGIFVEQVRLLKKNHKSQMSLHLDDLYAKAKRLGAQEAHLKQVVQLSHSLWDRLARVHKLKPEWKTYLTAAAILHDVGEAVTPSRHEFHSYYIIKNANFPSMEPWETDFVAELCLHHRDGKAEIKDLPFKREKAYRQAFLKTLALLRIADALDRGHKTNVKVKQVRVTPRQVEIRLSGSVADLELLRVEQKKALFEKVFGRELVVSKG